MNKSKSRSKSRFKEKRVKPKIVAKLKKNYNRRKESQNLVEKFTFGIKDPSKSRDNSKTRQGSKKYIKYKKQNFEDLRQELGLNDYNDEDYDNIDFEEYSRNKENYQVNGSKSFQRFMEIQDLSENRKNSYDEIFEKKISAFQFERKTRWFDC